MRLETNGDDVVTVIDEFGGARAQRYTSENFRRIQRCSSFIGAVSSWRMIERLADPEQQTRRHALDLLKELARLSFIDCGGQAFSPQHADCLDYCGMKARGMHPPGVLAEEGRASAIKPLSRHCHSIISYSRWPDSPPDCRCWRSSAACLCW
jgi:hypothetical protein